MALKRILIVAGTLACFTAGCVSDEARPPAEDVAQVAQHAKKNKPVVSDDPAPPSACTALYSGPQAMAMLSSAVVDPDIVTDGSLQTLILTLNDDDDVAEAADLLTLSLGLAPGLGLGIFENLPMLAVRVPVTAATLDLLKASLQPLGLLSIYQDRPLQFFLHESVPLIQADVARTAFKTTGKGIGVAVIDSGVDGTQGDFAGLKKNVKLLGPIIDEPVGGYWYVEAANTDLTSGHGTHVASTIGGTGAQSGGKYRGVAPDANLIGVGTGDAISILYALEGFDYTFKPEIHETYNVRVISNSWGSSGSHFAPYNPISLAVKRAHDLGMVVLFAAGNDGPNADTLNPYSASPCVISVAAGDKAGQLASFSSRGIPGDELHHPDITAPGVSIVAARAVTGAVTPPHTGDLQYGAFYSRISGTSMATPHMSGVVALMLEVNPSLDLDGVLDILSATATPMLAPGTSTPHAEWEVGAGYVNVFKAVEEAHKTAGARSTLVTSQLASWTGLVPLAIDGLVTAEHNFSVSVPAGSAALRVRTEWGNPAQDLDMYIYGPSGALVASSAQGATAFEAVSIPAPATGTYRVQMKGWLNGPTSYTGKAERDELVPVQLP